MPRLTVTIDDDHEEILERLSEEGGPCESKSEAVRMCIQQYERDADRVEDLQAEIDDLETAVDRLEREKRLILEQREEKKELANYLEDERTYREQSLATRLKWWLRGKPADA